MKFFYENSLKHVYKQFERQIVACFILSLFHYKIIFYALCVRQETTRRTFHFQILLSLLRARRLGVKWYGV